MEMKLKPSLDKFVETIINNGYEVFTSEEIADKIKDGLIKSHNNVLSNEEKDEFVAEMLFLNKSICTDKNGKDTTVYYRKPLIEYDKDSNGQILKSRSGRYADTPENRRLHRVGQSYGGTKGGEEDDKEGEKDDKEGEKGDIKGTLSSEQIERIEKRIKTLSETGGKKDEITRLQNFIDKHKNTDSEKDSRRKKFEFNDSNLKTREKVSEEQKVHADKILKVLHEKGFSNFKISSSITDFGVSTYIQGDLGLKFRLSDHGMSKMERIKNEIPITFNTKPSEVLEIVSKRKEENEMRDKVLQEQEQKEKIKAKELEEKWNRIKDGLGDVVFKKMERTYQDLDKISSSGDKVRSNIYQKDLGGGAFYYEWTEERDPRSLGVKTPSKDWLENYKEEPESEDAKINDSESEEEVFYRVKFDDIPNSGQVNLKKYLSNKVKKSADEAWGDLSKINTEGLKKMEEGLVGDFNRQFHELPKSRRAEKLYGIMKIKAELTRREKMPIENKKHSPEDYINKINSESKRFNKEMSDSVGKNGWESETDNIHNNSARKIYSRNNYLESMKILPYIDLKTGDFKFSVQVNENPNIKNEAEEKAVLKVKKELMEKRFDTFKEASNYADKSAKDILDAAKNIELSVAEVYKILPLSERREIASAYSKYTVEELVSEKEKLEERAGNRMRSSSDRDSAKRQARSIGKLLSAYNRIKEARTEKF